MTRDECEHRVRALVSAARKLADNRTAEGTAARAMLLETTGLSAQGIELALCEHLETTLSKEQLTALLDAAGSASRVHVLLAANVFVGALRALTVAVGAALEVVVRLSTREPSFARCLIEAIDDASVRASIRIVPTLEPAPGEHVHLYGSDRALAEVCSAFHPDVLVRLHGTGFGLAVIGADVDLDAAAQALARDVVPFDQRGCLSPRVALVEGDDARTQRFGEHVVRQLEDWAERVPLGHLAAEELSERRRFRDTSLMTGRVLDAGESVLAIAKESWLLPPPGRNLVLAVCNDGDTCLLSLRAVASFVAALGIAGHGGVLAQRVAAIAPRARRSVLGAMQRPALDGPVDRRSDGLVRVGELQLNSRR